MKMMSMSEYERLMVEDEHKIQKEPCCYNCKYLVDDYGEYFCFFEGEDFVPEDYYVRLPDVRCEKWCSCISGLTHEKYLERVKEGKK